jgi:two-component system response regulator
MDSELLGVTVLIVEDHDDLREAFRLTLRYLGATVFEASDGHEALELVARAKPQVILCDLHMPRWTGLSSSRGSGLGDSA